MFSWAPFAILRFSLFFIIGILCAIYTDERIAFQWAICFLLFSIVLFLILRLTKPKLLQAYGYALVMLFAFFTGYLCLFFHNVKNEQDHIGHFNERIEAYQLHVSLAPEEKAKSYKIEGEILRIKTQGQWQAASGKVLLYVSHSAASAAIQYGDILLIQGTPQPLSGPANPHEFDYKRFLSFRNIYHQQFVPDGQWMCLGSDPKHLSIFYAQQIR
ncbi:MAG TPA: ComEC/Rec2 family competence protein, partial [Cyclobacteriaceae bacterium]|nr:ComEC/Rec2 family competence protein [Cyclobacteriaceae bacterium]